MHLSLEKENPQKAGKGDKRVSTRPALVWVQKTMIFSSDICEIALVLNWHSRKAYWTVGI